MALWADKVQDFAALESAARKSLELLDRYRTIFRNSGFISDADFPVEQGDAWERLGRAYLKKHQFDAALSAFRSAASLFAGRKDDIGLARQYRLHLHLAELHDARGEPAEALPHLTAYLQLRPQSIEPYRLLVSVLRRSNTGGEAVARLAEYAHKDKGNIALQLFLADQYGEGNSFNEALLIYETLLKEQPKVEYYRGLLKLCLRFRQMEQVLIRLDDQLKTADDGSKSEEARDLANRHAHALYSALKESPATLRAILPVALDEMMRQFRVKQNFSYKTFEKLAGLAAQAQELEASERLFREALKGIQFPGLRATVDEPLIQVLLARHKYAEVIELCESRLSRTELNQFMYTYYMAFPEAVIRGLQPGLRMAEQAVELATQEDWKLMARVTKVNILLWHDEKNRAIEEAEKLLADFRQPKQMRRVRLTLARVYGAVRDHARAEQQLRMLLASDPNDAQANNDLGYQLADQGRQLEEAERLIRRAPGKRPPRPAARQ